MLIWRRLSSICGAKYLWDINSCSFPAVPLLISSRSPDFAILCPRQPSEKRPERACVWKHLLPGQPVLGVQEKLRGIKGGMWACRQHPDLRKGGLDTHGGSLAWSGTSGPVACACHRGGEPSDFKTLPAWITTPTGRNNTVLWDGGSVQEVCG